MPGMPGMPVRSSCIDVMPVGSRSIVPMPIILRPCWGRRADPIALCPCPSYPAHAGHAGRIS
jgi:hypothetical protein